METAAVRQQDYNRLNTWLPPKLEARGMTVEDLAVAARVSRRVIYMWLKDEARPTTQTMAKIVHALSEARLLGAVEVYEKVELEDALRQYIERKAGRPKGSGGGARAVTTRGRR